MALRRFRSEWRLNKYTAVVAEGITYVYQKRQMPRKHVTLVVLWCAYLFIKLFFFASLAAFFRSGYLLQLARSFR